MYDHLPWLAAGTTHFPDTNTAMDEPNGLVAFGGDLSAEQLIAAYQQGIFPWYSDDQPIMWWSPNPRMVLYPERFKLTRSLKKSIQNKSYRVTLDTAFTQVIDACAQPRDHEDGTWITAQMKRAYTQLHTLGRAHSIEVWDAEDQLVGGLYGVSVGDVFCGESMFSRATDASKIALYTLVQRCPPLGIRLIDCQIASKHLARLGAETMARKDYLKELQTGQHTQVDWSGF